jgi:hypothetical protein
MSILDSCISNNHKINKAINFKSEQCRIIYNFVIVCIIGCLPINIGVPAIASMYVVTILMEKVMF